MKSLGLGLGLETVLFTSVVEW